MLRELEREKRILERMYHDRMDVYRNTIVKNPDTGESSLREVQIYETRKCSLVKNTGSPERGTVAGNVTEEHVIFADPDIHLNNNDRVVVRTESGQVYEGRSGMTYVIRNHGETGYRIEKMA